MSQLPTKLVSLVSGEHVRTDNTLNMSLVSVVRTALKKFPVSTKPPGGVQSGKLQGESHQMLEELGHSQMLPRGQSCVCNPLFRFGDLSIDTLCTRQKLSSESLTLVHPLTVSCLSYSSVARGRLR